MSNLPGAITKRPNDHMVNASFGNPAVETTTFHIAQQDHFVETRINRDGTINRILVPDRADRGTSDDPRLPPDWGDPAYTELFPNAASQCHSLCMNPLFWNGLKRMY